jgi:hypothetical protein
MLKSGALNLLLSLYKAISIPFLMELGIARNMPLKIIWLYGLKIDHSIEVRSGKGKTASRIHTYDKNGCRNFLLHVHIFPCFKLP